MSEQIEAVQRMQDYIEAHLGEEFTLYELAEAAMFSPWHAHRIFTKYTSMTPADYIRRLRLSRSALRLRDERCRVIDAAMDAGFGSVDGYTRAFRREFGCNPGDYAQNPVPIALLTPYRVENPNHERRKPMEKTSFIFTQIVERPARRVILKRAVTAAHYFAYCEEVGCNIWGILSSYRSPFGEPVAMWLPDAYVKPGTGIYVHGVELEPDFDGVVPEGFDVIDLPAATYLRFQGEPYDDDFYREAIGAVCSAIARFDPASLGYCWDEHSPRIQLAPIGARGCIELHPIRKF